jgi:hypothetical protein
VSELFQWPDEGGAELRDGLSPAEVVEALFAPEQLRLDNRTPPRAPTFLAVCAPTEQQRLIVAVCVRDDQAQPWTIVGARDAGTDERAMWRKHTR